MKEGLPGVTLACHRGASSRRPTLMLHAGLDLSRRRLDVCLLSEHGELVAQTAAPPDADGLRGLADRVGRYGDLLHASIVRGVVRRLSLPPRRSGSRRPATPLRRSVCVARTNSVSPLPRFNGRTGSQTVAGGRTTRPGCRAPRQARFEAQDRRPRPATSSPGAQRGCPRSVGAHRRRPRRAP